MHLGNERYGDWAAKFALPALVVLTALALGAWRLHPHPLVPVAVAVAPIVLVVALSRPYLICLLFIAFTYFRIHEAYPALQPLQIPMVLAALTMLTVFWNIAIVRSVKPYLSTELALFLVFFVIVTIGVAFAINRPLAFEYWSGTYWKIVAVSTAIAWLARTPKDFAWTTRIILASGLLIAIIAINNKLMGIGLVEGTRVTVAPGILGDPNDVALVLLLPLSFAVSATIYRISKLDTLLAFVATPLILWAILATQSRGGLLGTIAVLAFIAFRYMKSKLLVGALVVAGAVGLFAMSNIADRTSGGAKEIAAAGIDQSANERLIAWRAATNMAIHRPLTGVGIGNFASNYYFYTDAWVGRAMAVHSTWFGILAEGGVIAFAIFVSMVFLSWQSARNSLETLISLGVQGSAPALALGLQAAILGFCVSGTFLHQGFTWPIGIYIALISAIAHYTKKLANERSPPQVDKTAEALG